MKRHGAWDEACASVTAIATNALVKDFYIVITVSNFNKVAPRSN
jgi:hypothetical protein